jgi:hypothetical protein
MLGVVAVDVQNLDPVVAVHPGAVLLALELAHTPVSRYGGLGFSVPGLPVLRLSTVTVSAKTAEALTPSKARRQAILKKPLIFWLFMVRRCCGCIGINGDEMEAGRACRCSAR